MPQHTDKVDTSDGQHNHAHRCRACGAEIDASSSAFPFCSDLCRWSDLGKWFDGAYRISRDVKDSDLETID